MSKSFCEELNSLRKSGSCCRSSSARDGTPVFGFRLRKSSGVRVNPELKSAPTQTNGRELTTASTFFYNGFQSNLSLTNLSNTLWKRLLYNSDKSFIKTTHPGGQFNDEAPLYAFVGQVTLCGRTCSRELPCFLNS